MQGGATGHRIGLAHRARQRLRRVAERTRHHVQGMPIRLAERAAGLPVPPPRLLHDIGNSVDPTWFLRGGRWAAEDIRNAVARHGVPMEDLGALLDFGCGVGRVVRHWSGLAAAGVEIVGTDANPAMIDWCRRHLRFGRFAVNTLDGRVEAPDDRFGLAYALSVFTHMGAARQRHWMAEMRRVIRPGGLLVLTLHGDAYRDGLPPGLRERYDRGEMVEVGTDREGSNDCAAFHPPRTLAYGLAEGWEILEWHPRAARGNPVQDFYLIRKPKDAERPTPAESG